MEFDEKNKIQNNEKNYSIENLKIARHFSESIIKEMKDLILSITIFGSNATRTSKKTSDIDLLIILNNTSIIVSDELRTAYKIISNKLNYKLANGKIHLTTLNFTNYWDMVRIGDPIIINILRYGYPIYDKNIIEPFKYLLEIGKIKPSLEALNNYTIRAQSLIENVNKHYEFSIMDLYYSIIDICHATLMTKKITPPSPKNMPKLFNENFKEEKFKKISKLIKKLYDIVKKIEHKKNIKINGKLIDELKLEVENTIIFLSKHNNKYLSKKDIFWI